MANCWTASPVFDEYPIDLRLDMLLVGDTRVMQRIKQAIVAIAPSAAPVLIQGPTGAGKEVVAQAIHTLSEREGAMVAVNCGAIPADLLESELFGHEKGAFTGAHTRHIDLIEQAQNGTLFLDEIGEMPLNVQVKLLRALETRTIQRVGGNAPIEVDFRLLSATHRDLKEKVAEGSFRQDLLFRIDVFAIPVPALKEHAADIPLLLRTMTANAREARTLQLTPEALRMVTSYDWPGNVRELRNFHDRAQVLFRGRQITPNEITSVLLPGYSEVEKPAHVGTVTIEAPDLREAIAEKGSVDLRSMLQQIEEKLILDALQLSDGRVTQAAEMLRLKRTTLIGKMQKLGIQTAA